MAEHRLLAHTADMLDFSAFRAVVSQSVVPLDVHTPDPDAFSGHLDAGGAGDIHVFDIVADGHSVHRNISRIAQGAAPHFKFSLMLEGEGMIVQDGRETSLRAGDMAIYDTDRPYSLLFDDRVHMGIVMFPKGLIDIPSDAVRHVTATRFDSTTGVGAMVRPYLSQLTRQAGGLDAHVARRLARSAVDLVATLLEERLAESTIETGHESLLRGILSYIDDHLSEPDLCPAQIAAAHFVSVRHLHGLFATHGTSVSTTIRTRRLERCYDDLVSPLRADRSVTTIALSHGFVDAAHFSRTFRAHYGMPPSAVRSAR